MSEPTNAPRSAEIHFKIRLNREQMPESIEWSATDASADDAKSTKSIMLSVWNDKEQKAMRIDLWTSAMLVDEMKLFTFQTLMTMADTFERATSEKEMAGEMRTFAQSFAEKMGFVEHKGAEGEH